jgi:hypothetical protein
MNWNEFESKRDLEQFSILYQYSPGEGNCKKPRPTRGLGVQDETKHRGACNQHVESTFFYSFY